MHLCFYSTVRITRQVPRYGTAPRVHVNPSDRNFFQGGGWVGLVWFGLVWLVGPGPFCAEFGLWEGRMVRGREGGRREGVAVVLGLVSR